MIRSDQRNQSHQQWRITPAGGGFYRVTHSKSGKALSVLGTCMDEKSYIVPWEYEGYPSQQWILERP